MEPYLTVSHHREVKVEGWGSQAEDGRRRAKEGLFSDRKWHLSDRLSLLCYNTFPFPKISAEKKKEIEEAAENVLITREYYPEKTLAELYDPDKMPQDLREAHAKLDDIVESCYPGYPFASDEARLECLFKLYEKMTAAKK